MKEAARQRQKKPQTPADKPNGKPKYTGDFLVVGTDARRGFITLLSPELAAQLKPNQRGNCILYVKTGGQT
jgi:hypothetical protein